MSILCAVCQTENREGAMFCKGCAAKLPAFMATGPSVLEIMKAKRPAPAMAGGPALASAGADMPPSWMRLPAETRSFWVRGGLFMLVLLVAFLAWYLHATRKLPAPAIRSVPDSAAAAAVAPAPASVAPPASTAAGTPNAATAAATPPSQADSGAKPASEIPVISSLTTGELMVAPGPDAPARSAADRPASPRIAAPRQDVGPADPRRGCEHLNFIFAARCEAANCDKSAFTRHPRCDLVREERKRDEARRNPTLGF